MSFYNEDFTDCENIYNNKKCSIKNIPGLVVREISEPFDFDGFRNSREFFFLDNRNREPDKEALDTGFKIDKNLMEQYLNIRKSKLGYKNSLPNQYSKCDQLDSRHYMMSTFIFSYLNSISFNPDNILEIGGGFGNWCYINQDIVDYKKWTILDLPFVNDLQRWFIDKEVKDKSRINLIGYGNDSYKNLISDSGDFDLVIAAHSYSEIKMEIFEEYLYKILPKTKYLFYAYSKIQHNGKGDPQKKINLLNKYFLKIKEINSEKGITGNIIYKNKKYID